MPGQRRNQPIKQSSPEVLLHANQVRHLYSGMPVALGAQLLLVIMLVIALRPVLSQMQILGLLLALGTVLIWRAGMYWQHRNASPIPDEQAIGWLSRFRWGLITNGMVWGLADILFFPPGEVVYQAILAFMFMGLGTGGAIALSVDRVSSLGFFVPVTLPLILNLVMEWNQITLIMGFLVFVFSGFVIINILRIQGQLQENIQLRIKAVAHEQVIHWRAEVESMLAEAAAQLLTASTNEIDDAIDPILERTGTQLGADRAYLFLYSDNGEKMSNTHEWCAPGIHPEIDNLQDMPREAMAWWFDQLENRGMLIISDVAEMPPEAEEVKLILEDQDIKSLVVFPLLRSGETFGFFGFDAVRSRRNWASAEMESLTVLADILSGAITRQRAEKSLIAARDEAERANSAKSDFLSRMSHELRTPLNAILGFGQLLEIEAKKSLPQEQADNVQEILHAGRHLLELINEVLDLSRIESGRLDVSLEPVALAPLIKASVSHMGPLAMERGISIRLQLDETGDVQANAIRLKQVLLNLLSNAIKYNQEKGHIRVYCQQLDQQMRISVEDSGPGIEEGSLKHLFKPFERLETTGKNVEGTGIGLALTKKLVEAMSGELGVESAPGKGSTFWFTLPIAADL